MRQLSVYEKAWPVAGKFTISRSSLSTIPTVWVEIREKGKTGRAECRPYPRYGQTVESVIAEIESFRNIIEKGSSKADLNARMRPGPARNALDCALWDLEAKLSGISVIERLGLPVPKPRPTAYTLSLDTSDAMAAAAAKAQAFPLLKIKVNADIAIESTQAIIKSRPDAKLIIDANEDLDRVGLDALIDSLPLENIAMIEQPLSSSFKLERPFVSSPVICADESLHAEDDITSDDLQKLWDQGYRAINIKLDKCGGLSAALALMKLAKEKKFQIMAGCMVGSSLAMAPMMMLESYADVLDLDGPLLLAEDCKDGLKYEGPTINPPTPKLWG